MKIISVSRRTDIPAFYSEWFMNRIRDGYVRWVNPFSGVIHQTSLRPEDVMAFVFWSKNYIPMLPYLDELDANSYRMLFHFTITGLPKVFEPNVPDAAETVLCARTLSYRYGIDAVLWRYDPILISTITDHVYHINRFRELCIELEGVVSRCYISFTKPYAKVMRNIKLLHNETGIEYRDLLLNDRMEIANSFADIAGEHGITLFSCCGDYLVSGKIKKAHCVDAELLTRLYPEKVRRLAKMPTRDSCGCSECTDIGAYDTCPHGCIYCYANTRMQIALKNYGDHNPHLDMLNARLGVDTKEIPIQQRKHQNVGNLKLDL